MKKTQRRATLQGYGPFEADGNQARGSSAKRPQDHLAPRRRKWNLDAQKIIQELNCHESFTTGDGHELTDMPRFSDMANYELSEADQIQLWTLETNRLVNIVNAGEPVELEGLDEWFGVADADGYDRLHKLATQLLYAISICSADNELLLLNFEPMSSNPTNFRSYRTRLLKSFGPEGAMHSGIDSIQLTKENDPCYQALVNYVTGTLIQVLLRAVDGEFWDHNVVISLAKLAAKIKIVGFDIQKAATVCLAGAQDWENRLRHEQKNDLPPPSGKDLPNPKDRQLSAAQRHISHEGHQYFRTMDAFHQCIGVLISRVARELISDRTTAAPDSFEASSIIYDTGILQQRSMLFQNRSGAIGGSANQDDIHCAGFAFEVCLEVLEKLRGMAPRVQRMGSNSDPTPYTTVYWKWTEITTSGNSQDYPSSWGHVAKAQEAVQLTQPRTGCIQLSSMKDIITAYVPFVILCGDFPSQLKPMVRTVNSLNNTGVTRTCEGDRFLASFVFRTSNCHVPVDSDATSISISAVARKRALSEWNQSSVSPGRSTDQGRTDSQLRDEFQLDNAEIASGLKLIHSWVIDQKSIIIPYRWYCWGTLGLCGCLVFGGLTIGFSVQERIQGVDPFNISVFCWVLAGFLILLFKSIRVQEWPWRDFFLGRVVCRSVSEVVAVSSIKPQMLLQVLLYLEPVIGLEKRGPFATIFTRRDPDGFAIDVPIGTEALNRGGCFFVKVQTNSGPALICIRQVIQHPYHAVEPGGDSKEGSEAKCRDLDTPWRWGKHPDEGPLYTLMSNELSWTRVIGLHCGEAYFY